MPARFGCFVVPLVIELQEPVQDDSVDRVSGIFKLAGFGRVWPVATLSACAGTPSKQESKHSTVRFFHASGHLGAVLSDDFIYSWGDMTPR
jgi:hypothetical protein